MKIKTILTCLILLSAVFVRAQTASLEGLKNFSSSAISPIFDGKETKGYTLFYKADKANKGNDNYEISIYDENLTKTKTVSMQKPRGKFFMLGNGFNGSEIAFYFYNFKDDQFEIEAYDQSLKKVASRTIKEKLSNMEEYAIQARREADEKDEGSLGIEISLYPVPGSGFVRNGVMKNGKGFSLEMLDNDLKTKWKHQTSEDSKEYEGFFLYETTSKYLIGTTARRSGLMSKNVTYYITAFDTENGKKALEIPVESAGTSDQLSINTIKYDSVDNKVIVFGDYYGEKDKPGISKSKGFYIKSFTMDGTEKDKKFYSWDKDMKAMLPPEAKESLDKGAMNFIHRALRGSDGKYYLVCEQFCKVADALGIASNVLSRGGGASSAKAVVYNIIIYVLNADLSISDVKFFLKDKSNVTMPPGAGMAPIGMFGWITKSVGGFDYQFTQMTNDGKSYDVVYIDYDKEKGESTKRILGNIIISPDGKFNNDKMDITTKATESYLYPAKPGYLMMVDYLKKEKTLGMKMIKLNN